MLEYTLKIQRTNLVKIKQGIQQILVIQKNGKILKKELLHLIEDSQKKSNKKWLSKPIYPLDDKKIPHEWRDIENNLNAGLVIQTTTNHYKNKLEKRIHNDFSSRCFMKKSFQETWGSHSIQAFLVPGYSTPIFVYLLDKQIVVCLGNYYNKVLFTKKELKDFFEYVSLSKEKLLTKKKDYKNIL